MVAFAYWCLQDDIGEEESGWKLIHGDVFRFPRWATRLLALERWESIAHVMFFLNSLLCFFFAFFFRLYSIRVRILVHVFFFFFVFCTRYLLLGLLLCDLIPSFWFFFSYWKKDGPAYAVRFFAKSDGIKSDLRIRWPESPKSEKRWACLCSPILQNPTG